MSSYKCMIVDDEPLARKVIKNYLTGLEGFELVGEASSAVEAFSMMESLDIDLIFLDIHMPELTGLDFIRTMDSKTSIIITTAYREHAVEGFELNVLDYLVKPITLPRFMNALNKFRNTIALERRTEHHTEQGEEFMFIKADKRMVKTYFDEILYIESLKDYVKVVTESEQLITHCNLSQFTERIPKDRFIRIHKSFTVSKAKIKALEGNRVELAGMKLPIGRNYQQLVKGEILKKSS